MSGADSENRFSRDRAELFETLGHPVRIRLLQVLAESPLGFSELKRAIGVESSGQLQFHLGKLQGLVKNTPEGNYALTDEGKEALRIVAALPHPESAPQTKAGRRRKWLTPTLVVLLVLSIASNAGLACYSHFQSEFTAGMDDVKFVNARLYNTSLIQTDIGAWIGFNWEAYCVNPTCSPIYFRLDYVDVSIHVNCSPLTLRGFRMGASGTTSSWTPYGTYYQNPFAAYFRIAPYSSVRINGTLYFGPSPPEQEYVQEWVAIYNCLIEDGVDVNEMILTGVFSNDIPFVNVEKTMRLSYAEISLWSY
ncbi:MAG TPA: helix-turn-helix domain-containing protein [Candidatus Methanomethylicus sp.]|nr:helix-turn-helix domain-containing protein [Candidatus Methanomethylicus sp.]